MQIEEMIEGLSYEAFHNMPAMVGDAVLPRWMADIIIAKLRAAEELARSCERRWDLTDWQKKALEEYENAGKEPGT